MTTVAATNSTTSHHRRTDSSFSPQRSRRPQQQRMITTLERPGAMLQQSQHSKSFGTTTAVPPLSPSLSRTHTDTTTTCTSVTTTRNTPPTPPQLVRRACTISNSSISIQYDGLALLAGRPRRINHAVTGNTPPTIFSFGSRVGESSVYSASPLTAASALPTTTTPAVTTSTSANSIGSRNSSRGNKRSTTTVSEPLWKQVLPVVVQRRPPPAQLCRSRTGCLA
jgi:hypothetical protein